MKKSKISISPILALLVILIMISGMAYQVLKQQSKDVKLRNYISILNAQSSMIVSALEQSASLGGHIANIELLTEYMEEYDRAILLVDGFEKTKQVQNVKVTWERIKSQLTKIVLLVEKQKELGFIDIKIQSEIISMSSAAQKLLAEISSNGSRKIDNGIRVLSLTNNIATTTLITAKKMSRNELGKYSDNFNSFDATLKTAIIELSQDIKQKRVINSSAVHSNAVIVAAKRDIISSLGRNRIGLIGEQIETADKISLVLSEIEGWLVEHKTLTSFANQISNERPININIVIYLSVVLSLISVIMFIYGQVTTNSDKNNTIDESLSLKMVSEHKSKTMMDLLAQLKKMEAGELNIQLTEGVDALGQIAQAVNKVISGLREVVGESKSIAINIDSISKAVSANTQRAKEEKHKQTQKIGDIATTSSKINSLLKSIDDGSEITISTARKVASMALNADEKTTLSMGAAKTVIENQQHMASKTKSTIEMVQTLREKALEISEISQEAKLVSVNLGLIAAEADGRLEKRIKASSDNIATFAKTIKEYSADVVLSASKVCSEAQEVQRVIDGSIEATSTMLSHGEIIKKEVLALRVEVIDVGESAGKVKDRVLTVGEMTEGIVSSVRSAQESAQQNYDDSEKTAVQIEGLADKSARIVKITDKFIT